MRKAVKRAFKKRKPKIFNALNLVLIGFLLIEVALILDYNFTGLIISKTATSEVGVSGEVGEESGWWSEGTGSEENNPLNPDFTPGEKSKWKMLWIIFLL